MDWGKEGMKMTAQLLLLLLLNHGRMLLNEPNRA